MDYHHHARLTVHGREVLCRSVVEGRLGLCEAVAEHRLSRQSAAKWVRRYREQGLDGLKDRSSRPRRLRQPTSTEQVLLIETLRRERWTGSRIAQQTGLSRATVSRVLARAMLIRMPSRFSRPVKVSLVNCAPWSVLNISGFSSMESASSSASTQKAVSIVIDTRQASTRRLNQSTTAAR